MKKTRGFTLIELMVVILIVSILAAVAIPILRGRIDAAKWSEGKAMAGTIATALRAYAAEKGETNTGTWPPSITNDLGFLPSDLNGTYFASTNFSITSATYVATRATPLNFTINVTAGAGMTSPVSVTLNHSGVWTETAVATP